MGDDLTKAQKAKIKRGLDKIVQTRTDQMADRLTENSYYAYSEGDKAAQKAMNLHLTVKIVQKEATQYMKEYGSLIKKEGNIMIPVYKKMADGADELTGYTKYNLMGHSATQDKKKIFDIIQKEYKKGTPTGLKQTKKGTYPKDSLAKQLEKHFGMQKSHASLVARAEAQRITDQGQRIRYQKLGVTQARWKTSGDDRVRDQHTIRQEHGIYEMDKIPSLGEPNCRCTIVPVLDTENPLPPETKPITKKQESKSLLTPKKIAPDEASVLARTMGGTRYTPEQALEKVVGEVEDAGMKPYLNYMAKEVNKLRDEILEQNKFIEALPRGGVRQEEMLKIYPMLDKLARYNEAIENETKKLAKKARRHLLNDKPNTGITMVKGDGLPIRPGRKQIYDRLLKGQGFVQNIVSPKLLKNKGHHEIEYFKTNCGRAFSTKNQIHINDHDSIATIIHECGHTVEDYMSHDFDSSFVTDLNTYLTTRTEGEKFELLSHITGNTGYGDEFAKKDEFYIPYMGKFYGWKTMDELNELGEGFSTTRATEFISVSIEKMYEDPVRFAIQDPESFKFAFSLIKGF